MKSHLKRQYVPRSVSLHDAHTFSSTGVRDVVCKECGKAFADKSNLWHHMRSMHQAKSSSANDGRPAPYTIKKEQLLTPLPLRARRQSSSSLGSSSQSRSTSVSAPESSAAISPSRSVSPMPSNGGFPTIGDRSTWSPPKRSVTLLREAKVDYSDLSVRPSVHAMSRSEKKSTAFTFIKADCLESTGKYSRHH
jgi:hypothetical protein